MAWASSGHRSPTPEQQCPSGLSLGHYWCVFLPKPSRKYVTSLCDWTEQIPFLTQIRDSRAERGWKSSNDRLSLGAGHVTDTDLVALLSHLSDRGCHGDGNAPAVHICSAHAPLPLPSEFCLWKNSRNKSDHEQPPFFTPLPFLLPCTEIEYT